MSLLVGERITKRFGGLTVINDLSFCIDRDSIVSLIGPNGAGKTTLFNIITGLCGAEAGNIRLEEKSISHLKPHEICRRGIGRTFQISKTFGRMTILENVLVGCHFGTTKKIAEGKARQRAQELLNLVGLGDKGRLVPGVLNTMDLKRLEVARALATGPKILALDEVVTGLNPSETAEAIQLIKHIQNIFGISVFLIEHVMQVVMSISDRIIVLDHGEKVTDGPPAEVARDERVIECYLGESYHFEEQEAVDA